jgi:hypothetical protein
MDGYDHNTRWRTFKTMILAEKSSGDYNLYASGHIFKNSTVFENSTQPPFGKGRR